MARPSSEAFQVWPCQCDSMVQNRRIAAAGTVMPSCGMSRSRNVRTNPSRHAMLPVSDAARYDRGSPPRSQSVRHASAPVSARSKPASSMNSTRPASDSEAPRATSGDALPRTRKRDCPSSRSTRTRSALKSCGMRWISSSTTSPCSAPRASSGLASRRTSGSDSRSKKVAWRVAANCRARVVFPHWRGPCSAVIGARAVATASWRRESVRWSIRTRQSENSEPASEFSGSCPQCVLGRVSQLASSSLSWRSM